MTLFLDSADIRALASDDVLLAAARDAVAAERDGTAVVPPRLDVATGKGFLRVMPAAQGPVSGLKVMTLAEGLGTRYLILVYNRDGGELAAVLDGEEITRMRTAATTAIAAEILRPEGASTLGVIGTGFEATGHLTMFAARWPINRAVVFSPSEERRRAFADRMSEQLGLVVEAVDSPAKVCAQTETVVLATKSKLPVVDGKSFHPGAVVLSIGSTRPDLRELDRDTLARAATLVVDDPAQVLQESGDVIDAVGSGVLEHDRIVAMGAARERLAATPDGVDGRDLLVFKSVGTAVQDLALARVLVDMAASRGRGRDLGELAHLKPFSGSSG